MEVLVAHRDASARRSLAKALRGDGCDVQEVADGESALSHLLGEEPPRVAVVDWDLPVIEGPELCRLVHDFHLQRPPYIILLAAAGHHAEVTSGLLAGANDCLRTPVADAELRGRVEMGIHFVELPWGRGGARLTQRPSLATSG